MCLTDYFNYAFGITQDDDVVSLVIKLKRFTKMMSKDYKPGDRVIASTEKSKDKRGEVIRSKDTALQRGYTVKLDEQGTEEDILEMDLEAEHLSPSEIGTEITKLKKLVEEEADKISNKVVKELPEHLTYLQNALVESRDKSESENEFTYISKEMKRAFGSNLVEENISLKKLKYSWEKSLPSK
ncbi:hypothetical protein [Nostoc sp. 'Peltigera membranacea cyanobiont' N6]|uniref:hypothetical protein n=1 Tax=Nostoc sp. 'Peltigera membranacea cyanobiont' N6 TaxID=1261031 RepID=UPI000CF31F85|nr:hypothetical protein [Nostoc sp. 'Peltigera membranacea cyanobiont' N6]AVH68417.1 hypothetical protein NPM_30002 [Nostoc sp. 'Peltigera membranacea cyanobiont' N6]